MTIKYEDEGEHRLRRLIHLQVPTEPAETLLGLLLVQGILPQRLLNPKLRLTNVSALHHYLPILLHHIKDNPRQLGVEVLLRPAEDILVEVQAVTLTQDPEGNRGLALVRNLLHRLRLPPRYFHCLQE
jgi:hypothetical protein